VTFWVGVAVAYVIVVGCGLSLGRYLAERFPRHGHGGGLGPDLPTPTPYGPTHAMQCPPLGSAFDRALLPGAFEDAPVAQHAA
jgi:hypothetical protein